jgi:threonine/homoserine efflux transporter RhtA
MRLPKSVPESQKYVTWAFPITLGFGIAALIDANWQGRIAVIVGMCIVFTGWSSFAMIEERSYNDLLLVCDLALITTYVLLLYYGKTLPLKLGSSDLGLWTTSAATFGLYSIWDFAALIGRDTRALASSAHLRKFGFICAALAAPFAIGAIIVNQQISSTESADADVTISLRVAILILWTLILCWWHYGRVVAALADGRNEDG